MSAAEDPVTLSLDLLRRLPPASVAGNVEKLTQVLPDVADELTSGVDQPLTVRVDQTTAGAGREYLCCDYNREGQSWRSWRSNAFDPPLEDAFIPAGKLRDLELRANDAFDTYRQLYYDTGYTSTYLWDVSGESSASALPASFAGAVLFKKGTPTRIQAPLIAELDGPTHADAIGSRGCWDSLHVFEVEQQSGARSAAFKLSSTVMLTLGKRTAESGAVDLSGSLTRQVCGQRYASPDARRVSRCCPSVTLRASSRTWAAWSRTSRARSAISYRRCTLARRAT